jgi:hypothetical protein
MRWIRYVKLKEEEGSTTPAIIRQEVIQRPVDLPVKLVQEVAVPIIVPPPMAGVPVRQAVTT